MTLRLTLTLLVTGLFLSVAGQQGADRPTSRTYLLGPGDVVEIKVFGQPDLSTNAQVDADGNLSSLAFLEPISAKCRTEREVQKSVTVAYARLVKEPQVSVRIVEKNSRPPATVFGAVRQSAKVPMLKRMRLNELVAASGGFTENAAGTIQILHTEPVMCPGAGDEEEALPIDATMIPMQIVKISDLKKGTSGANPIIRPGDLVLIAEAEPVYVVGNVISPGSVLLREQLTLSRVLGMVGGTRREANLSKIMIRRQKPGSNEQELIPVDFEAIKNNRQPDVVLKAYDIVDVSENGFLTWVNLKDVMLGLLTGGVRKVVLPN
jgi:polysaccharide biosynthesis/export protein